jgi:heat shock protein HslJ
MNRLLLIALPTLLAACAKPGGEPPTTTPVADVPATKVAATDAPSPIAAVAPNAPTQLAFKNVPMIRAVAVLPRQQWRLSTATDAKGQRIDALLVRADKPLQLEFQRSGKVAIGNACNAISGPYKFRGRAIELGPYAATKMACADPKLAALDAEVGTRLQGDFTYRMAVGAAPAIELRSSRGDMLVFLGSDTADARFGGPGERVFLEVAADTKPCSDPLIPDKQCLQAREIKYDDKGLKIGTPGAFGNFHDTIEGYRHEAGVRKVLRLQRYTRKQVPADASKYAYVLDMVVESEAPKAQ